MEVCNNKDLWPELTLEMIQIARLLDLGIMNHLPEQILQLSDIPREVNRDQLMSNGGFTFFDDVSNKKISKIVSAGFRGRNTYLRNAAEIIAEDTVAHDKILGAMIAQSAQRGADAWINHETHQAEIGLCTAELGERLTRCDRALEDAMRQTQNALNQHNQSLRVSKQRNGAEGSLLLLYRQCLAHSSHMVIKRGRALEALQCSNLEAEAERERGAWLSMGAQHAVSMRAAQVIERARQARALVRLQDSLHAACAEHRQAALVHSVHKTVSSVNLVRITELGIVRVREQLREEGRQRKFLHEKELSFFQMETRRLRGDEEARLERDALLFAVADARCECDHVTSLR